MILLGLLLLFVSMCSGYLMEDSDKRQDLVPFPRVGRELWDDKRQALIPFPRVGRQFGEGKRQMIPNIRTGRSSWSTEDVDYEDVDDISEDPYWLWTTSKRMALTPRIGRKKRSTQPEDNRQSGDDSEFSKTLRNTPWELLNWNLPEGAANEAALFQRLSRQLIPSPRVGRGDNTGLQLRAAFIPRLGKKSDHSVAEDNDDALKRAALTPRIGRAYSYKNDDHNIDTRVSFTPRIGRRALFTPRIGRSVRSVNDSESKPINEQH